MLNNVLNTNDDTLLEEEKIQLGILFDPYLEPSRKKVPKSFFFLHCSRT